MATRRIIYHLAVQQGEPSKDSLWINPYNGVARIYAGKKGWLELQGPLFVQLNAKVDAEVKTLTDRIAADEEKIQTNANNIATNTANIKTNAESIAALEKSKQDTLTAGYGIDIAEDGTISVTIDNSLFVFKDTLPEKPDDGKEEKIYVIPSGGEEGNVCNEYVWIADDTKEIGGYWELFGSATLSIDLTDYYTKDETDKAIKDAIDALATKDELKRYLPLTGGTLTGDLTVKGTTTVNAQETEDITQEAGLLVAGKDGKVSLVTLDELAKALGEKTYTFTINPTPADARVVINGEETSSVSVEKGIEVEWSVSADGYETQRGSQVVMKDTTINVELAEAVVTDGVYVAYIDAEGAKRIIDPSEWDESLGEAQGVLVGDGSHEVLVAPTETESTMQWGQYGTLIDGVTTTTGTSTAQGDYEGKVNTAACVAAGIDETCAAGWCNAYSHGAIGVGEWWLPACGDFHNLIYPHISEINNALTVIGGASLSTSSSYWSSTQYSSSHAWYVRMSDGGAYGNTKSSTYRVRAVSAFDYDV